ncbi:hypothetical protein BSKO_03469 [Bryopsis sp. KO-2023]|nr:hypothetical protein BSKO_03469 [Bryopsis sp. KO-2023]
MTARPSSFEGFRVAKVVGDRPQDKQLAIVGRFEGSDEDAVVVVTQKHLAKDDAGELLRGITKLDAHFENDIYSKYDAVPPSDLASLTVDLIYPATEQHIQKHTDQEYAMVRETQADFEKCTLPFINSFPASRMQWVYNILEGKAEVDRILFEDSDPDIGFMLIPDLKWDQKNLEELYCVAICKRRDIRSLRDLNVSQLPLLKHIRDQGCEAIESKFGVSRDQLRIFVHYPPSYYHFHVHFTHVKCQGNGAMVGKAHLLEDILENIEFVDGDYYKKRSLFFVLGKNTDHWRRFQQQQPK